MGLSIHLNFLKNTPYSQTVSPLGAVLALFKATIHESYLDWISIPANLAGRAVHVGNLYTFKGPVFILPPTANPILLKVALTASAALIGGFVLTRLSKRVRKILGTILTGVLLAAPAWKIFSRIVPSRPGIYLIQLTSLPITIHKILSGGR